MERPEIQRVIDDLQGCSDAAVFVLRLAFDRGLRGATFATSDELRTPGYDAAWTAGRDARVSP